jgi:hypothetical protein
MSSRWIAAVLAAVLMVPLVSRAAAPPDADAFASTSEPVGILELDATGPAIDVAPMLPAQTEAPLDATLEGQASSLFDDKALFGLSDLRGSASSPTTYSYLAERDRSLVDLAPLMSRGRALNSRPVESGPGHPTDMFYTVVDEKASTQREIVLPAAMAAIASSLCGVMALVWWRQHRSGA